MKYGDTFQQRSIPEWGNYNVDYNDIKHLIKVRTTKSQSGAISIPGQSDEQDELKAFEGELYAELLDQHQRIDLFVWSKSGEIKRRLDHLYRQVLRLGRTNLVDKQKRIPIRRLEKYSRIEGDTLKAGEEIQSLARFVGAQRVAFLKLLKKYKKWTGSSGLGSRFQSEVLGQPTSFVQKDFGPLLSQWTDVLAAVRAPFDAGLNWKAWSGDERDLRPDSEPVKPEDDRTAMSSRNASSAKDASVTSAANLYNIYQAGSEVDIDTALATVPLGPHAGKAAYWVHPEDLVQIHVLLLQHTRLRRKPSSRSSTGPSSPTLSRQGSIRGSVNSGLLGAEEETGTILCDDLQSFSKRRNTATISDTETLPGNLPEEAAASIRYSSTGEAVIAVNESATYPSGSLVYNNMLLKKAKFKRKSLIRLFEDPKPVSSRPWSPTFTRDTTSINEESQQNFETVRTWLREHHEVQPLVHLQCKRTRFVGLGNNELRGIWITLDKDVSMKRSSVKELGDQIALSNFDIGSCERFPYAILEVRWEGETQPDIVTALDESHLTERVRGFSLETHAVATICKPTDMPAPFWLPALDRDIRKLPAKPSHPRRKSSITLSQEAGSTRPTSTSTTSVTDGPTSSGFSAVQIATPSPGTSVPDQLEVSPLKAFKKKSRKQRQNSLRRDVINSNTSYERYWNEFDDGDEAPADEPFTVFVDPDAGLSFPGSATLSKFFSTVFAMAESSAEKIRTWLKPRQSSKVKDRRPRRLEEDFLRSPNADSDADSDTESLLPPHHASNPTTSYSTFPHDQRPSTPHALATRNAHLLFASVLAFAASTALLLVAAILETSGRRKYVVRADIGSAVGVVGSLVFAIVGVSAAVARKNRGRMGDFLVGVGTVGVLVGNVGVVWGLVGHW